MKKITSKIFFESNEQTALTKFIETWKITNEMLPLTDLEKDNILSVIKKCNVRLKDITIENLSKIKTKNERKAAMAKNKSELSTLNKNHSRNKADKIAASHKATKFTEWKTILSGSFGQPKK